MTKRRNAKKKTVMIPKFLMGLLHLAFDLQEEFVDAIDKDG